ncbi:MAG: hypothetical protein DRI94_15265 [Bacteroidetes bacterium]|nr:MAG: hypothetical protein DRI94_15265 [Bacteroidota bacterium]
MKNILKITIILTSVLVIISGCVKENFDTTPEYVTSLEANTSIADLKAMFTNSSVLIDTNIVIKGIVISNDEYGNFYKELFIEDETGAVGIELDDGYLYEKYPVGRLVYVNCKGLYLGKDYDVIKLGLSSNIDRINSAFIEDYIDISAGGEPVEPIVVDIADLTGNNLDSLIGSFIKIENVQFQDPEQTYANTGDNYSERTIVDCSGNDVVLSTSEYVSFINDSLPAGNGSINAVLSKFSGNYQLRINSPEDVDFTGNRCSK